MEMCFPFVHPAYEMLLYWAVLSMSLVMCLGVVIRLRAEICC